MMLDSSNITFSRKDVEDNVRIPNRLTSELAEFLGIMIGDGHIEDRKRTDRNSEKVYEMQITGNIKDKEYYINYVNPLIQKLFNIKFKVFERKKNNSIVLFKNSKAIHSFLKEKIDLVARKNNVRIPSIIRSGSSNIKSSFLRGLFDADFCLVIKYKPNPYPVVQGSAKSHKLICDVKLLLETLGIKSCIFKEKSYCLKRNKTYIKTAIFINGRKRVKQYLNKIGFANNNKLKKYMLLESKWLCNKLKII
jgi:intein/homing endonuclease